MPAAVGMPFVSQRSLTAMGTPCRGSRDLPRAISASGFFSLGKRKIGSDGRIAFQAAVQTRDPVENRTSCSERREFSRLNAPSDLDEIEMAGIDRCHDKPSLGAPLANRSDQYSASTSATVEEETTAGAAGWGTEPKQHGPAMARGRVRMPNVR